MDELQKKINERDGSPEPQDVLSSPFANAIMEEPLPRDFRFPTIKAYSGTTDPRAHLTRYRAAMMITEATDVILCRGFFATLDGQAHDWFGSLPARSISAFADLTRQFLSHFTTRIQRKKQIADLCDLKQGSSVSLAEYLRKWKKEAMGVADFDGKSAMVIFRNNLRSGAFHQGLISVNNDFNHNQKKGKQKFSPEDDYQEEVSSHYEANRHPGEKVEDNFALVKECGWLDE
ncbi:PREDICTED: uncharacterized protein LOC109180742 [Ipomoea nil]|uniref:uncharacterized protein LOC109180742 n=1 Tax=Ipomoea nil TaxID=35883 RepID=UPI0009019CE8|nr:PREDICTED: uncharacterized protein LOC109180742 [Ipomoea nil]